MINFLKRLFRRKVVATLHNIPIFLHVPWDMRWPDTSTAQHPWDHPRGMPYQLYGGPHAPETKRQEEQVWTSEKEVEGYKLTEDYYSDRLYHVYIREEDDSPISTP